MKTSFHHPGRFTQGFSLVEVALAVAIAALGIITCLGLLPEGLEMSRKTAQLAFNSNILEQIIRDAENASWPVVKPKHGLGAYPMETDGAAAGGGLTSFYYDSQGVQVDADSKKIAYVAQIDFSQNCGMPGATTPDEGFLARLVIKVANTSSTDFEFAPEGEGISYITFHHLIAKTR